MEKMFENVLNFIVAISVLLCLFIVALRTPLGKDATLVLVLLIDILLIAMGIVIYKFKDVL